MHPHFRNKLLAAASAAMISTAATAFAAEVHWGYHGDIGPEFWGSLTDSHGDLAFPLCGTGSEQSPIDLTGAGEDDELSSIDFDYQATPLKVKNNGHTIQVDYASGSSMSVNGATYSLLQFHFHVPSEHEVNGQAIPMEGHLVHARGSGESVELAVVGFLIEEGAHNPVIQSIWDNMPATEGEVTVPEASVDAADLLPGGERNYYAYDGSLTTPPCSEGVKWHVLTRPIEVSPAQVDQFSAIFDLNARPVQPLNARDLSVSDE